MKSNVIRKVTMMTFGFVAAALAIATPVHAEELNHTNEQTRPVAGWVSNAQQARNLLNDVIDGKTSEAEALRKMESLKWGASQTEQKEIQRYIEGATLLNGTQNSKVFIQKTNEGDAALANGREYDIDFVKPHGRADFTENIAKDEWGNESSVVIPDDFMKKYVKNVYLVDSRQK